MIQLKSSLSRRDFSPNLFLSQVLIIFICEKLLSTDAVPTGSVMKTLAKVYKLGNIVLSMSFVKRCFNCNDMSSFGSLAIYTVFTLTVYLALTRSGMHRLDIQLNLNTR